MKSKKQLEIIRENEDYYAKISAPGFDPTTVGLTDDDVQSIGAKLTGAKTGLAGRNAAVDTKKSTTGDFSGAGGALDVLMDERRSHNNKIRISDATDGTCEGLGAPRRKASPTPRTITSDAPEFTLDAVLPGSIRLRAREKGSASARARTPNASGIQIAIVDGTTAKADNEADGAPSLFPSRSPMEISSAGMPDKVRLYARWRTQTGLVSNWSLPLLITVIRS